MSVPHVRPISAKLGCSTCRLRELCLPLGLDKNALAKLDVVINRRQQVKAGQHIFRAGHAFHFLYAIRNGVFKTYNISKGGGEQISGFHMGGEILGLDAMHDESHTSNAIALEDSEVCEIPFTNLEELIRQVPALQRQFHKILSKEINKDHGTALR